jgi:hypothetical protein
MIRLQIRGCERRFSESCCGLGILPFGPMRRRLFLALALFTGSGPGCLAIESGYLPLTIVRAEVKTRDRVAYWLVNTPVYQEDPYFEVVVRAARTVIVAEHEPVAHEPLPEYWKQGTRVQGRVDRRHLFLRRPNGTEMRFIIIRRTKAPPAQE